MEDVLTETEQEHSQLIDFQNERINRMEQEISDLRTTLLATMEMLTAYFQQVTTEREAMNDSDDTE